ncbi:conserved Plasmodium protein, unknown function [Plasmodium sp. gorilla clade G2]|uniref:conserved Plasmodium protein, unknown function n=1 Tax=Plasmodium sp. gorilla clade G2 TaxID=880535 RepID=UPI000D208BA6|nr:conserved Plasmodium protein, unknown function [Plasmodium sp. gorilla clade G2]SOV16991.1 conserved Plasmodium protein, unknown function [Plasmodium sp. gorilla clade G2]
MITSINVIHELLTTIYCCIFSRKRKDIYKYDVLLYLQDYYYFDVIKRVSDDIKELDDDSITIEINNNEYEDITNGNTSSSFFNSTFENFCIHRGYDIIKDKTYSNEYEKRVDFLHELLCDLLCLLLNKNNETKKENDEKNNNNKKKNINYNKDRTINKMYHNDNYYLLKKSWEHIQDILKDINILNENKYVEDNINEKNIKDILYIQKEKLIKNEDIIIKKNVDINKITLLNNLIEKYNNEYKFRFYYIFLNNYLTIQTMLTSNMIYLYSYEIQNIIQKIIKIKINLYQPLTIYDVLSFQYDQIVFHKSSYMNLISPVKKIKILNNIVERGGDPDEFSKKVIIKDVINANISLKAKFNKARTQNDNNWGNSKYKVRNYYDNNRR